MRRFSLCEFSDEEIKKAKDFIKAAIYGFLTVKLDTMIDDQFEELSMFTFDGNDTLHFKIDIETLGNDFLAALGSARNCLTR